MKFPSMTLDNPIAQIVVSLAFLAMAVGTWAKVIAAWSKFLNDQHKRSVAPTPQKAVPAKSGLGKFLIVNWICSFIFMSWMLQFLEAPSGPPTHKFILGAALLAVLIGCHLTIVTILCFVLSIANSHTDLFEAMIGRMHLLAHAQCTADHCIHEKAKAQQEGEQKAAGNRAGRSVAS